VILLRARVLVSVTRMGVTAINLRFGWIFCAVWLLAASTALADHICTNSPGEAFVGHSQSGNGVAPMPIFRWLEHESPPPPKVVERWEVFDDRFGAWAIDESGAFGVSYGELSREVADRKALQMCRERGGQRCVAIGQFRNLCSTFAWGGGRSNFDAGESVALSERRTLLRVDWIPVSSATSFKRFAACRFRDGCMKSPTTGCLHSDSGRRAWLLPVSWSPQSVQVLRRVSLTQLGEGRVR